MLNLSRSISRTDWVHTGGTEGVLVSNQRVTSFLQVSSVGTSVLGI
jgi:hypothetical protein